MKNFLLKKKLFIIKIINNKYYIFCIIRKRFYILTPEEWIRQNLIQFLIEEKKYNNIYVEFPILFNSRKKRVDIIIFKNNYPYILIECKSPKIKINFMKTIEQIFIYYYKLKSRYIMITNGIYNKIFFIYNHKIFFIEDLPINK